MGIGVPVVQCDSIDDGEDEAVWEIDDGSTITATINIPTAINFKLFSGNQYSNQFLDFS